MVDTFTLQCMLAGCRVWRCVAIHSWQRGYIIATHSSCLTCGKARPACSCATACETTNHRQPIAATVTCPSVCAAGHMPAAC
jgi:hypothetical protein